MWYKIAQNLLKQLENKQQGILKIPQVKTTDIMKPAFNPYPAQKTWTKDFLQPKPEVSKNAGKKLITQTVEASAYVATGNKTASGTIPTPGRTIAVPKSIPLGTPVFVNGKPYIAEDTGRLITEGHIDIFMGSQKEAIQFGRQPVKISYYI